MNELSCFSGVCGGLLGTSALLGFRTVGYVENEPYAQEVIKARIADGCLDAAPIFGDIRRFIAQNRRERPRSYARVYRGMVDVVSGGFPCVDISNAGKRAGIHAPRSGLWKAMRRVVGLVRPRYVFIENVAALVVRGLSVVLADLAELGYDAEWDCFRASDVGAPHRRKRIFILAHRHGCGRTERTDEGEPEPTGRAGAREFEGGFGELADANTSRHLRDTRRSSEGWIHGPERRIARGHAGSEGELLADADAAGFERTRGQLFGDRDAQRGHDTGHSGSTSVVNTVRQRLEEQRGSVATRAELGGLECPSLFPPGPSDRGAWVRVLAERPDLAPALPNPESRSSRTAWTGGEARGATEGDALESPVRGMADGRSDWMDRALSDRTKRLRGLGNAQVAECAAVAFVMLSRRFAR